MAQDLKKLFKETTSNTSAKMSEGHEMRFFEKLETEFPKKQKFIYRLKFLNVAASVVILIGLGYSALQYFNKSGHINTSKQEISNTIKSLGEVSPDLKKVEDYYLASINLELSKIQLTPSNKELFDGYVQRLKELDGEYNKLILELEDDGLNQETLDALIDNLKFRLNLVMHLKEKLKEFNDQSFLEQKV